MNGSEDTSREDLVFTLTAICASVGREQLLTDDDVVATLIDYGCWEVHLRDWHQRRPAAWRRRPLRDWRAEGAELSRQRHEIFQQARTCGIVS